MPDRRVYFILKVMIAKIASETVFARRQLRHSLYIDTKCCKTPISPFPWFHTAASRSFHPVGWRAAAAAAAVRLDGTTLAPASLSALPGAVRMGEKRDKVMLQLLSPKSVRGCKNRWRQGAREGTKVLVVVPVSVPSAEDSSCSEPMAALKSTHRTYLFGMGRGTGQDRMYLLSTLDKQAVN